MTKKRVVDFLLALTGGAIALVGYFYIEDWYYWVVALGGGLLMLIFLILMVRDGLASTATNQCFHEEYHYYQCETEYNNRRIDVRNTFPTIDPYFVVPSQ